MSIIPNTISSSLAEISRENPAFLGNQAGWKETPEAHVLQADLPGLRKEELKVQVEDGGVLTISGERSVQREDASAAGYRVECSSGTFSRRFTLPENARIDQVQASMDNDILTVTVPKKEVTAKAIENSN